MKKVLIPAFVFLFSVAIGSSSAHAYYNPGTVMGYNAPSSTVNEYNYGYTTGYAYNPNVGYNYYPNNYNNYNSYQGQSSYVAGYQGYQQPYYNDMGWGNNYKNNYSYPYSNNYPCMHYNY